MTPTKRERSQLRRQSEAGHWLIRLREDALSEAEVEAWLAWSADAGNLAELERMQSLHAAVAQNAARPRGTLLPAPARQAARPSRRRFALFAAAAALVLAVGGSLQWLPIFQESGVQPQVFSTGKAVHREISLADGSLAILGAQSRLTVIYGPDSRHVRVDAGEAFFKVKKDAQRRFIVEAGNLSAIAVGTAFDVRRDADRAVVTVAEGVVDVEAQDRSAATAPVAAQVRAYAGERVTLQFEATALTVASVSTTTAGNWRQGQLEFSAEPLSVVIANVNRYLPREIEIADPQIAILIYSGTVQPAYIDEWVLALEAIFPLRAERNGKGGLVLKPLTKAPNPTAVAKETS